MNERVDNGSALESVSETVNRTMFVLITFSAFCMLSVGSPDRDMLFSEPSIRLPIVDTDVSSYSFLCLAPSILIAIATYLHVFESERRRLLKATAGDAPQSRYLFTIQTRVTSALTIFFFYILVPVTFAALTYKALVLGNLGIAMFSVFVLVCSAFSILLHLRSASDDNKRPGIIAIATCTALILVLGIVAREYLRRPLETTRAILDEVNLPQADLQGATLFQASLSRAFLYGANLEHADLRGADLSEADLSGASLRGAKLSGAKLSGAKLEGADLRFADLFRADLTGANMKINHTFLTHADLRETKLQDVSFSPQFGEEGPKQASGFLEQAEEFGANTCGAAMSDGGRLRDSGCVAYDFGSRHFFELILGGGGVDESDGNRQRPPD
jgi:hypothetical protein